MHVSGLFIYPVKSLRGLSVMSVELDALGLVGDRRFMVVDENGRFLTQRSLPRMALIETALTHDCLVLSAHGVNNVLVKRESDPAASLRTVSVWSSEGLRTEDCGDSAATWLGGFLGVNCRLVRAGAHFHRPMDKPGKARMDDVMGFGDGY